MRISGLVLQYFRIHTSYAIKFNQQVTLIIGSNASGKTSILEAIALLSTGKSFRAQKISEIISLDQEISRIKGLVEPENTSVDTFDQATASLADETIPSAHEKQEIEVMLTRGQVNGRRTSYRLFSLNEVRKQQRKVTGILKTVLFRPEDMRLIEGSPSRRRDYFDVPLSLLFEEYEQSLKTYEQILKRRNKLLFLVKEGVQPRSVLEYWNIGLIKHGEILQEYRRKFISTAPSIDFPIRMQLEYDPSIISAERVKMYLEKEITVGHTLIGPHKDDFSVSYFLEKAEEPLNIALYGSRGQQRLAVLWLKLLELAYVEQQSGERPVLLLDDIFSELDPTSQKLVLELLSVGQTIITTIDPELEKVLQDRFDGRLQVIKMEGRELI